MVGREGEGEVQGEAWGFGEGATGEGGGRREGGPKVAEGEWEARGWVEREGEGEDGWEARGWGRGNTAGKAQRKAKPVGKERVLEKERG